VEHCLVITLLLQAEAAADKLQSILAVEELAVLELHLVNH
jgi:hypothetical protein